MLSTPPPTISRRTLIPCRHISIEPLESHNFQIRLSSRNGTSRIKENWVSYWIHATLPQEQSGFTCNNNFCIYSTTAPMAIDTKLTGTMYLKNVTWVCACMCACTILCAWKFQKWKFHRKLINKMIHVYVCIGSNSYTTKHAQSINNRVSGFGL